MPLTQSTSRYPATCQVPSSTMATRICPMLWVTPPATLTPTMLNFSDFFNSIMVKPDNSPPARE